MTYKVERFLHIVRLAFIISVVVWVGAFVIITLFDPTLSTMFPPSIILIPLSVIVAAVILVYVTRHSRRNRAEPTRAMLGYVYSSLDSRYDLIERGFLYFYMFQVLTDNAQ